MPGRSGDERSRFRSDSSPKREEEHALMASELQILRDQARGGEIRSRAGRASGFSS